MDFSRFKTPDWLVIGGGLAVLVAGFIDWFDTGPISLISDRGLRYGVPNLETAAGLGLDSPRPAPESIIRLLPTGSSLNTADVQRSYDSVQIPSNAGSFPTPQPQANGASPPGN